MEQPITLQQAIIHYSDADNCIAFLVSQRWPDGNVTCPICGAEGAKYLPRRVWQCKSRHPKSQFSIKVGTVMEDSALGLDKWLTAMWLLANSKNGVSSHELAKSVGVTQKSAWHMMHRIRLAMRDEAPTTLGGGSEGGPVEVDEAFVGGEPKNWHNSKRIAHHKAVRSQRVRTYQNAFTHKTAILGMLDRDSRKVRAMVVPNVRRETLQSQILETIEFGSTVYTDQAVTYKSLKDKYVHDTVNHATQYVNGQVHTNGIENFWSLMKRNLKGTYVAVEPFHLDRYLDEQVFRYNNRRLKNDGQRFVAVVSQIIGKRLTYSELTGKKQAEVF